MLSLIEHKKSLLSIRFSVQVDRAVYTKLKHHGSGINFNLDEKTFGSKFNCLGNLLKLSSL